MQKIYDEKLKKIVDSIELVTNYAKPLIEKEKLHDSACNDVYYVIFDKNYEPYFVAIKRSTLKDDLSYYLYRVNQQAKHLIQDDQIGNLELIISEEKAYLSYLQLYKKDYINKKIGSKLIDLFDYIAFTKGTKRANGISTTLNSNYISQEKLNDFYEKKRLGSR